MNIDAVKDLKARGEKKKAKSDDDGPEEVQIRTSPGKRVETKGGARNMPTDDAVRVAAAKQKARASTTDSLSTKELQEVVNRMNLEQQYAKLNPPKVSLGKEFAKMVFENDKKKLAQTGDWQQTSTYKLGTTALQITKFAIDATSKKKKTS